MELSLRLDTLGMVEVRYLRGGAFLPICSRLFLLLVLSTFASPEETRIG